MTTAASDRAEALDGERRLLDPGCLRSSLRVRGDDGRAHQVPVLFGEDQGVRVACDQGPDGVPPA